MMLPISISLILTLAAPLVQAANVLERQVGTGSSSGFPISPTRTVTKVVVTTSTAISPPPASTLPITSRFIVTYTRSGHITLSTATVTLQPNVPTSTQFAGESNSDRGSSSKGAIAGGVLGTLAAIVAIFTIFIWYRRRSPSHWRNRTIGRWHIIDNKDARAIYVGEPVHRVRGDAKQSDPRPLPPLYIRDRQPTTDPFGLPPSSPASPRAYARSASASGTIGQGRDSTHQLDIELEPRSK